MNDTKLPVAVLLVGVLLAGCGNMIDTDSPEDLVSAEVHLLRGFEGHWVSVSLSGNIYFKECLNFAAPSAGPLAVFRLDVPSGTHQLLIRWVPTDGDRQAHLSSVNIRLDQGEYYYLGINAAENSVQVAIQESSFMYV